MTRLDLRVRALGWALGRASLSGKSDADLVRMQRRAIGHNVVTDFMFGSVVQGVEITDTRIAGTAGELSVRTYRMPGGKADRQLVLYFHGGGWVFGSLDMGDHVCSNIASRVDAVVVSVAYRLAPLFRFPAGLEDCYTALVWAVSHSTELGANGSSVGVVGESAGGNLAAAVCLLAKERSGPPIRHQALIYPAIDLTLSSASMLANDRAPILSAADMGEMRDRYLGDQDRRQPHASPIFATDHSSLPPALIQVAEHDPLRDDGIRYADVLDRSHVPVRVTEYVGMPHGYLNFPLLCKAAPQALAEFCAEIARSGYYNRPDESRESDGRGGGRG
jgi:acetyl esterase/lipase